MAKTAKVATAQTRISRVDGCVEHAGVPIRLHLHVGERRIYTHRHKNIWPGFVFRATEARRWSRELRGDRTLSYACGVLEMQYDNDHIRATGTRARAFDYLEIARELFDPNDVLLLLLRPTNRAGYWSQQCCSHPNYSHNIC